MPVRLGDILIRRKQIAPHQLGVALSVQKKARLPLGQILVQNNIISRLQLFTALLLQKISGLFNSRPSLSTEAQVRLETHLRNAEIPQENDPQQETLHLREDLAGLPPTRAGRIVEKEEAIKERLMSGNF